MAYAAKIVADSISEAGDRLTTMEVTFPRFVLAEFNTHRMFSRNSASSRAIPTAKQFERIAEDPAIPVHWGKNQPGMQAESELEGQDRSDAVEQWLAARDSAVVHAENLLQLGVHKQVVNRLLEPFMWHTVIVTATEWNNFFALRAHRDAQPEIRVIAEMMKELYETSTPKLLRRGEWHLPFIQPDEYDYAFEYSEEARKISAARCARVSYLTHDGRRDLNKDIELYERLVTGGHMSPLEHVATPEFATRQGIEMFDLGDGVYTYTHSSEFIGNFKGWKQFRKFIPNEHDYSLVKKKE